jgi:hypothetical protein
MKTTRITESQITHALKEYEGANKAGSQYPQRNRICPESHQIRLEAL